MANPDLTFSPLAEIFPLMEGQEFDDLVADIKAHGLHEPIVIFRGQILDGRNRYRACVAADIDCQTTPYIGNDPLAFVISLNLKRRHLNDDQRRMVAARLANLGRGRPSENPADCGIKLPDAARMVNVDAAGIERARTVLTHATPEIAAAVDRGKLTVAAAALATKLDVETQRKVAAQAEAGDSHAARNVIKKEVRAAREVELAVKTTALPSKRYNIIVEDYEWDFEVYSRETGMDRHAANHYPVSEDAHSAEEIVERTKDRITCAADDCALFMWTTVPHLAVAIDVLRLRGFRYASNWTWDKVNTGTGFWNRNRHEHLLLGIRGDIPCPALGEQWESLFSERSAAHSAKPEWFLELIESYFPNLPKIELNRRGAARPGWDAWGNQAQADPDDLSIPQRLRRVAP
jgi:N6-adenosine-specific RNA methylase IME4